ncbi:MAG TPA: hypothetical protein VHB74_15255 [Devosia sp.]|nr:hypothetical protein [Devosia sp.]
MSQEFVEAIEDMEAQWRVPEAAAQLEERYHLPPDVAWRIAEMSNNIDQAHAIAELMR